MHHSPYSSMLVITGIRPPCSPPDVNEAAPVVRAPAASGPGACIPPVFNRTSQSNLDKTGFRLIKRGCIVSRDAVHYEVVSIRLGSVCVLRRDAFGQVVPGSWLADQPAKSFYVVSR